MIRNRNIIIFGEDWGRFPSTTQHIGKVLLQFNRIMWIGSLAHRRPNFTLKDLKRIFEKLQKIFSGGKIRNSPIDSKVPIRIHPLIIPFHDIRIIRKINNKLLKRAIRQAKKKYQFNEPILITSSPLIGSLIGEIGETSSCYLCLDDYSHFDGAFNSILELEKELLNKISACFAVSELLVKSKKTKTGQTFFLPQGVLVEHFKKDNFKVPVKLRNLKKPVIGFFGLISEWIDLELIVYSAKKLPDYTFLIIGKPSIDISIFEDVLNIVFIGEIPFEDLPNYASAFDVGIISFKVNELTLSCNPLKLLEYLSLGIPVVSVNLPEVNKFKAFVQIANSNEDFVSKIRFSVEHDAQQKRFDRIAIAEKYSWQSITEFICEKIEEIEKINVQV